MGMHARGRIFGPFGPTKIIACITVVFLIANREAEADDSHWTSYQEPELPIGGRHQTNTVHDTTHSLRRNLLNATMTDEELTALVQQAATTAALAAAFQVASNTTTGTGNSFFNSSSESSSFDASGFFGALGGASLGGMATLGVGALVANYKEKVKEYHDKVKVIMEELPKRQAAILKTGRHYQNLIKEKLSAIKSSALEQQAELKKVQEEAANIKNMISSGEVGNAVQHKLDSKAVVVAIQSTLPSGSDPTPELEGAKETARIAEENVKKLQDDLVSAFPKLGKGILHAEDQEERMEIFEDAVESRKLHLERSFGKKTASAKREILELKKSMVDDVSIHVDEVHSILQQLPVVGATANMHLQQAWGQLARQMQDPDNELPSAPDPIGAVMGRIHALNSGVSPMMAMKEARNRAKQVIAQRAAGMSSNPGEGGVQSHTAIDGLMSAFSIGKGPVVPAGETSADARPRRKPRLPPLRNKNRTAPAAAEP